MVKKQVTLTIERKLIEKADELAEDYDTSRSQVVENLMKEAFGLRSIFSEGILREELGRELR